MGHTDWDIPGARGRTIHGSTHLPDGDARAVVVIVHGYKGYKDYGMFPWLAEHLARQGQVAHRVSLSHSGMGHGHGDFDEDAFEQDTYACGLEDVMRTIDAVQSGTLAGQGRPIVLLGHSRGGAMSLLTAGRMACDAGFGSVVGVIGLAAAARLLRISHDDLETLESTGQLPTASSRTGQMLHVGQAWLQEQLDDPAGHDLLKQVGEILVPVGLVHGTDDETVPAADAVTLAQANPARIQVRLLPEADHVFNTPNPFEVDGQASPQLAQAFELVTDWLDQWLS